MQTCDRGNEQKLALPLIVALSYCVQAWTVFATHKFANIRLLSVPLWLTLLFGWAMIQPAQAASLSEIERQQALALSKLSAWSTTARRAVADHPLGIQTLSIEFHDRKQAKNQRQARVYQYDYNQQSARVVTVDLTTNTVVNQQTIESAHLPLNAAEIDFAMAQLMASPDTIAQLQIEHTQRGHTPFFSIEEFDTKAFIYDPRDPLHHCATQRCALLSMFDNTHTVFILEPLVNLADGEVTLLD